MAQSALAPLVGMPSFTTKEKGSIRTWQIVLFDLREAIKEMKSEVSGDFTRRAIRRRAVYRLWVEPAGIRLSRLAVLSRLAIGLWG